MKINNHLILFVICLITIEMTTFKFITNTFVAGLKQLGAVDFP